MDKIEKIMAALEPENPDTDINQDFIESDYQWRSGLMSLNGWILKILLN